MGAQVQQKAISCDGKTAYATRPAADRAVIEILQRPAKKAYGGMKFETYKCAHCPAFHIGHVKK